MVCDVNDHDRSCRVCNGKVGPPRTCFSLQLLHLFLSRRYEGAGLSVIRVWSLASQRALQVSFFLKILTCSDLFQHNTTLLYLTVLARPFSIRLSQRSLLGQVLESADRSLSKLDFTGLNLGLLTSQ